MDHANGLASVTGWSAPLHKQCDYSLECQNGVLKLNLWAGRRLGELIWQTSGHTGGSPSHRVRDLPNGVSPMQSHRYQESFSLPESEFVSQARFQI